MIELTSISGRRFYINCDLIYKIEEIPDTVITLSDGKTIRVKNNAEDIVNRVIEFRRKIFHELPEASSK